MVFLKLLTLRAERFSPFRNCCTSAGVMLPISHWKARAKRQKDEGGGKVATPTGLEAASKPSQTFALMRLNDSTRAS